MSDSDSYLPRWRKVTASANAIVAPDERLPWPQTAAHGRAARDRDVRRHGAGAAS